MSARPPSRVCWREKRAIEFQQISAVFSGVADLKKAFEVARGRRASRQGDAAVRR